MIRLSDVCFNLLMPSFLGGIAKAVGGALSGGLGSSLLSGGLSFLGGERRNSAAQASTKEMMDFQERMSNSAHQRQVKDLRKAGLNPILSAKYGGASTPQGAMFNPTDTLTPAIHSALQTGSTMSSINLQSAQSNLSKQQAKVQENLSDTTKPISEVMTTVDNAIQAVKSKVDDSPEAITYALNTGGKIIGQTLDYLANHSATSKLLFSSPLIEVYRAWRNDPQSVAQWLSTAPDAYLKRFQDFIKEIKNKAYSSTGDKGQ